MYLFCNLILKLHASAEFRETIYRIKSWIIMDPAFKFLLTGCMHGRSLYGSFVDYYLLRPCPLEILEHARFTVHYFLEISD